MGRLNFACLVLCLAGLAAAAGCSQQAGNGAAVNAGAAPTPGASAQPGADAVRASVSEVRLAAGAAGEVVVSLNIGQGFHVNSNEPGDKFLIPTRLEVKTAAGFSPGAPVYPAGATKKFSFSETPLNVYEGTVQIRLPVRADASAPKGRHTLETSLTVQPCSDTECFQPRTINAAIPLLVE